MKMVLIMCSEILADPVRDTLSRCCSTMGCFSEIQRVHALVKGVRRMDSAAFPGTSNIFFASMSEDMLEEMRIHLRQIRTEGSEEGCLKAMLLEGQDLLGE